MYKKADPSRYMRDYLNIQVSIVPQSECCGRRPGFVFMCRHANVHNIIKISKSCHRAFDPTSNIQHPQTTQNCCVSLTVTRINLNLIHLQCSSLTELAGLVIILRPVTVLRMISHSKNGRLRSICSLQSWVSFSM